MPLFIQPWWLDAVAEGQWDAVTVTRGDQIVAAMPYLLKRRVGFTAITQPPLTQFLGPWIRSSDAKYAKRLSQEKEFMEELIDQLPPYDQFSQNWHFKQTNWLPFYWRDFKQTTRYTYRLDLQNDETALWRDLQENIRREIKKARNRFGLTVHTDCSHETLNKLSQQVFNRQNKKRPYSEALLEQLDRAATVHNARDLFVAQDESGRYHAAIYTLRDCDTTYYLIGGGDPDLRNSGATSLCMWNAILRARSQTRWFDFEGSMIPSIERYFRAFGARQTPYHHLHRTPSRLLRSGAAIREIIGW